MAEGRNVQLKGIGSFRIKAKSPAVSSPKEIRAENISFGGVVYTPEAKLLRSLSGTRFERAKEIHRSLELSDGEIDGTLCRARQHHYPGNVLTLRFKESHCFASAERTRGRRQAEASGIPPRSVLLSRGRMFWKRIKETDSVNRHTSPVFQNTLFW